ncbi:TIGR01777 family oxidoreductase [Paenibacillus hexagrammi]|uniref:TIGR01777 family oxidoreductase n=1 Tax=Paenibacillus hexagrammi TaxID=2908839 RepID=A0ABY3SDZ3_9BACL|nr:TIGR01777 family oxidoreductase [Paenibacillus sp. YPD9-1]UJF31640.1 TIGR01777 family oxidoreductase [Paenibacillus sp. YPD9-1]
MKIAIAGGTGFIGSRLISHLQNDGHEVFVISRRPSSGSAVPTITWKQFQDDSTDVIEVDAIVNLAGESINQRWTEQAKRRIIDSRLQAAKQIANWVQRMKAKPKVVVNASGMSIYGTSETEIFDEWSPHRDTDFLSHVVSLWEQAADQIQETRLVKIRVGIVLDRKEGAFPKMALPYKLGIGGKVGSGRQWMSWIHIEDMVRLIQFCIEREEVSGPVNATAPSPVTNAQFGQVLARTLRRPNLFPVPSFIFKLLFGELSVLLLEGQKVLPRTLLEHGFEFRFTTIEEALADIAGPQNKSFKNN